MPNAFFSFVQQDASYRGAGNRKIEGNLAYPSAWNLRKEGELDKVHRCLCCAPQLSSLLTFLCTGMFGPDFTWSPVVVVVVVVISTDDRYGGAPEAVDPEEDPEKEERRTDEIEGKLQLE